MRQIAGLISTYSSDEFGICSALFELGGMVVMHDASGCNSTYTTHDEPRWYDMDSMIYISAISEMEAILGDDNKLIDDLIETAGELHPAFIAIVGAPIPYMIGTDFGAIAEIVEQATGIPSVGFETNGMHCYTGGVSAALEWLVKRMVEPGAEKTEQPSVNILGATPLDYSVNGSVESIRDWLKSGGFSVCSCFAMGSSLEEIRQAGRAHVNLVISYGGLAAAKVLERECGIPYVAGVPFGEKQAEELLQLLRQTAQSKKSCVSYRQMSADSVKKEGTKQIGIIGESVFSAALGYALEAEHDIATRVLCPVDTDPELLRKYDRETPEEDDLMRELATLDAVIADPLYRSICPKHVTFYPLPHEAFSGRIYDDVNPNLIGARLEENR